MVLAVNTVSVMMALSNLALVRLLSLKSVVETVASLRFVLVILAAVKSVFVKLQLLRLDSDKFASANM